MGKRVSDSEDVGEANARADAAAISQGEKDFGPKNSSIRNRATMPNPEPRVSPLIRVYPYGSDDLQPDHTIGDELPGVRHYHRRAKD